MCCTDTSSGSKVSCRSLQLHLRAYTSNTNSITLGWQAEEMI